MAYVKQEENSLRSLRKRLGYTQAYVASLLGVQRELVAMWEAGTRKPTIEQVERLESVLNTSITNVLFPNDNPERDLPKQHFDERAFREALKENDLLRDTGLVDLWLDFLDRWAEVAARYDIPLKGPATIVKPLQDLVDVTDARKARTAAQRVRDYLELGSAALPFPWPLLEANHYFVFEAELGSAACLFYNHKGLGPCLLLNSKMSVDAKWLMLFRQLAIGLFHHRQLAHVTPQGRGVARYEKPIDRFTYAFAKHFAVPESTLRRVAAEFAPWGINAKNGLQVVEDLELYFRVTDQIILERLLDERMIEYEYFLERRSPPYNPNADMVRSSSPIFRYPNSIKQAAWHITNARGSAISDIEKLFYHEGPFFQWKKLLFPYG